MNPETALWLSLGAAPLALVYGVVSAKWILGRSAGSERMQAIATAIQEGAKAYINRQYTTIGIVGAVFYPITNALMGADSTNLYLAALIGLALTAAMVVITEYYTGGGRAYDLALSPQPFDIKRQATTSLITRPCTSVRRKSRPWNR